METVSTGIPGLDEILRGGLPSSSMHLVQGPPGSGKTTMALQFLREGAARGEKTLYVTLSQTARDLHRIADSHGWDIGSVEIVELQAESLGEVSDQSIFQTVDLRLDRTRQAVQDAIERVGPDRMVYDSLLEVRLLSPGDDRYQRELMGLRHFIEARGITVILIDIEPTDEPTMDTQSRGIVHSVLTFDKVIPSFGRARRRLQISKVRGIDAADGWHDMDIRTGDGVVVFPRLVPAAADRSTKAGDPIRSGRDRLDDMFGGGMEAGTTTMVVGQAGTGKSTIASLYATAALKRGERVALFLFEERLETFFRRSAGLGMDLRSYYDSGQLQIYDFNPDAISAGEFGQLVQQETSGDDLRVLVIDSFTGYMASLGHENQALYDIQALLKHTARRNVLTFLIVAQTGLLGGGGETPMDLSFLGDTVLFLRMREVDGHVRRDLVAVKKRHGPHALDVRRLIIEPGNVDVGSDE